MDDIALELLQEAGCTLAIERIPRSRNHEIFQRLALMTGFFENDIAGGILFERLLDPCNLKPIFVVDSYDFSIIVKKTASSELSDFCKNHNISGENVLLWCIYGLNDFGVAKIDDVIENIDYLCYYINDLLIIDEHFNWLISKPHYGAFFYVQKKDFKILVNGKD